MGKKKMEYIGNGLGLKYNNFSELLAQDLTVIAPTYDSGAGTITLSITDDMRVYCR